MGLYLGARTKKEIDGRQVWDYAPIELFESVDKGMFVIKTTPEIQYTTLARKLFKRLDIKVDENEMCNDLSNSDLFKIYKETHRILNTWTPTPFNEYEESLNTQVKWLHDFVEVCLLNDNIMVSLA